VYELIGSAFEGLENSGWFKGRRVSIEPAMEAWRKIDRLPRPGIAKVMLDVSGLVLNHPHHWAKDVIDSTDIDPVKAVHRTYAPVLSREYEAGAGQLLTPFGLMGCGVLMLIGEDGAVYGGNSSYLGKYGRSFWEFLNLIYSDQRPAVIYF
jgi:SUKH-3 immunity protein